MWQGNIITLTFTAMVWLIIGVVSYIFYSKQDEKPAVWKVVVVILGSLFSYSITLILFERTVQIAILPLGLFILLLILGRRDSWEKYQKYSLLGFFSNYLFLASTILGILVHGAIYPQEGHSHLYTGSFGCKNYRYSFICHEGCRV